MFLFAAIMQLIKKMKNAFKSKMTKTITLIFSFVSLISFFIFCIDFQFLSSPHAQRLQTCFTPLFIPTCLEKSQQTLLWD